MGDDERTSTPEAPATAQAADDDEHGGCCGLSLGDDEATDVARDAPQRIVTTCPDADTVRRLPRYAIFRRVARSSGDAGRRVRIYGRPLAQRDEDLTAEGYLDYLGCIGRSNPRIDDSSTWGNAEQIRLSVSHLVDEPAGERRLVYDPSAGHEWTFDVYNLVDVQTGWRRNLERTLKAFPIQFLRLLRLRIIFIDFFVGNELIGVPERRIARGRLGGPLGRSGAQVISGGANWPFWTDAVDVGGDSGVCITYSALNRPWTRNYRGLDDDGIDERFSSAHLRRNVLGTLYHEAGHIFHFVWGHRGELPESERGRNARATRDSALWDTYREESGYNVANRPTEGFAEAFRRRLQGASHPPEVSTEVRRRVDEALDALGVPTLASVVRAHGAIVDELS